MFILVEPCPFLVRNAMHFCYDAFLQQGEFGTALGEAVDAGHIEVVKLLLDHGCDKNPDNTVSSVTFG